MLQRESNREFDLQNLLSDERARCNQYRQIYQTLKDKHGKLQEELASIYQQLKEAISQNEQLKETNKSYIQKLEAIIREKQSEIDALSEKIKANDPIKLRDSILEEANKHFDEKIKEVQLEADKWREQYNSLHYEYTVLKCQFESRESEYSRTLEALKIQHHGELEQLKTKIEALEAEVSAQPDTYAIELQTSQREVFKLNSKLKSLLAELEEKQATNENLALQINSINRTHAKELAEHMSNIRALESEKMKVTMQKDVLAKELENIQEQRRVLSNQLQECKQESLRLKSQKEECEHNCNVITTDLKIECEHIKSEYETEKLTLMEEISKLQAEIRNKESKMNQSMEIFLEKEKHHDNNMLTLKQQMWQQNNKLEQEKECLIQKLKEMEDNHAKMLSKYTEEEEMLRKQLNIIVLAKNEVDKELALLKDKLEELQNKSDVSLSKQNEEYKKEIQDLKDRIATLNITEYNVRTPADTMLKAKSEEIKRDEHEIIQLKLEWEQQKLQFHQRMEDLMSQLKEAKNSASTQKKEMEYKLKQYAKLISKLRQKLEISKAKNEEQEIEKEILKKNVPPEIHSEVKKQLSELKRRLEEVQQEISIESQLAIGSLIPPSHTESVHTEKVGPSFSLETPLDKSVIDLKDKMDTKDIETPPKKLHSRRRSVKARNLERLHRKTSPVISSSSDLENL